MIESRMTIECSAPTVAGLTIDSQILAANPATRTITGRVLTFGEVGSTSVGPVRFAPGSLTALGDPGRVKLLVEHDRERIVGYAENIAATDTGVDVTFRVAPGVLGDEVLASAAAGLRDGLSIGVAVVEAQQAPDGILEVTASAWRETSVVALPAFPSALVTQVAATNAGPVHSPSAGPAPFYSASWGTQTAARPRSLDQAIDDIVAGFKVGGPHGALQAALTDIIPPADAGQKAALFRPTWLGELWTANKVDRPTIDSISHAPLTGFSVTGFRVNKPVFGVAEYNGNKEAVPSPGGFSVVPVTATARRIAGAHDIDRIFIDLGDASFVRSYFAYQAMNYGVLSEQWVVADLVAAATAVPAATSAVGAIGTLAAYLSSRGAAPSFMTFGSAVWAELIDTKNVDAPWLFGGSANITDQTATVGGVRLSVSAAIPADAVIAGDRRAATFYEWKNPPLSLEMVNLPNGGVDLGVFGYVADIVNDPSVIVKTTVA